MAVARVFVKHSLLIDGDPNAPTLRYWRGGWWLWRNTHWVEVETRTVRSLLYRFTEHAVYDELPELAEALGIVGFLSCKPWQPNRNKISNLLEALSAIVILPDDAEQPDWLDRRESGTLSLLVTGCLIWFRVNCSRTHRSFSIWSLCRLPTSRMLHEAAALAELSQCAMAT